MLAFIPGLELNQLFHDEVLRELMAAHFPKLKYSAGLMGEGSDVLGYDDPRSMDHNWGPRSVIFLAERDFPRWAERVGHMFAAELPLEFKGFPTNYTKPKMTYLVQRMKRIRRGPVNHMIRLFTVRSFFEYYLGYNPSRRIGLADWMTFPQQALLEVTGGAVYHDGLGTLRKTRDRFAYYPRQIWLYLLYCQWLRIANELSYQARSGEGGDELGSRILAARMVEEIVKLCFLMERRYVPYSKWRGSAFQRLPSAKKMEPLLRCTWEAPTWAQRQECFCRAYQLLGEMHNRLGITRPVSTELSDFHGRGYTVLDVGRFMRAIKENITHPSLSKMRYEIGSVDQFINHARINHERYLHRALRYVIR